MSKEDPQAKATRMMNYLLRCISDMPQNVEGIDIGSEEDVNLAFSAIVNAMCHAAKAMEIDKEMLLQDVSMVWDHVSPSSPPSDTTLN